MYESVEKIKLSESRGAGSESFELGAFPVGCVAQLRLYAAQLPFGAR